MDTIVNKAVRLALKRKYIEAEKILEPEVLKYKESCAFYYTLGLCHLYAGNLSAAYDYLLGARKIKLLDPNVLLALGAIFIRRNETRKAISYYLDVQEIDPNNKIARKALALLKKYGGSDDLIAWVDSGKLRALYPKFPKVPLQIRNIVLFVFFIVAFSALLLGILAKTTSIKTPFDNILSSAALEREGMDEIKLEGADRAKPVETGGLYRNIFTEKQILAIYDKARILFNERRDNAARFELNKLFESNANETIKNKARILESYLEAPGFDNLTDNYAYADVIKNPALYQGCFVKWRGMAVNLREGQTTTNFDLLVGYDTHVALEGAVPVRLPFAAAISTEEPLEVLGKIVVDAAAGDKPAMTLAGSAVHQPSVIIK
jgi:tetratricopeptide (TPR) repeat protein